MQRRLAAQRKIGWSFFADHRDELLTYVWKQAPARVVYHEIEFEDQTQTDDTQEKQ